MELLLLLLLLGAPDVSGAVGRVRRVGQSGEHRGGHLGGKAPNEDATVACGKKSKYLNNCISL